MLTVRFPPGARVSVCDFAGHALSLGEEIPHKTATLTFDVRRASGYPVFVVTHKGKVVARFPVGQGVNRGDTITLNTVAVDSSGYASLADHMADFDRRVNNLEKRAGVGHLRRDAELRAIWRRVRERFGAAQAAFDSLGPAVAAASKAIRLMGDQRFAIAAQYRTAGKASRQDAVMRAALLAGKSVVAYRDGAAHKVTLTPGHALRFTRIPKKAGWRSIFDRPIFDDKG